MKTPPTTHLFRAIGRAALSVLLFALFGSNAQGQDIQFVSPCKGEIQACSEHMDCEKGSQCVSREGCEVKECVPAALLCEEDTECGPCMACDDGICSVPQDVECVNDFYCDAGDICSFCGECVPYDDPCASAQPECLKDAHCGPGWECTQELECGTGICTPLPEPEPECAADMDCGTCGLCDSGVCGTLDFGECFTDLDCPDPHSCGECGACVFTPECLQDSDCGECDSCVDGTCEPENPAECSNDMDCSGVDTKCGACGMCEPVVCSSDADCSSECPGACMDGQCGIGSCTEPAPPQPPEPEPTEPEPTEPEPTDPANPNSIQTVGDLPEEVIPLAVGSGRQGGCAQRSSELPLFGIVLLGLLAALSIARGERRRREERIPIRVQKRDISDRV